MNPTRTQVQLTHPSTSPVGILLDAALYLAHRGWYQGEQYDPTDAVEYPAACAYGAIYTAGSGLTKYHSGAPTGAQHFDITTAAQVLADHLINKYDAPPQYNVALVIEDWNDETGRTVDEVITALTEAAVWWAYRTRTGGDAR